MFTLFTCLAIYTIQAQSPLTWVKKYDKAGVIIWTRGVKTTEYKAQVTVDADLEACVALLQDIDSHPKFMGSVRSVKLLKEYNNKESLIYLVIDMPFPMKDKDLVSQAKFDYQPDQNKVIVDISCQPDKAPAASYDRMRKADGHWTFHEAKKGKTQVTYQLAFEETGAPNWIVDYFILDNPKKIMNGFATLVKEPKYSSKNISWMN